jgi:hypothetical protein
MGTLAHYLAHYCSGRLLCLHQHFRCKASSSSRRLLSPRAFRWLVHRDHCPLDVGAKEQCTRRFLPMVSPSWLEFFP